MQLPAVNPIRVVIADDHHLFLEGVISLLKGYGDLDIKGYAYNGVELIEKVRKEIPDIVLTGIKMPEVNGIEATKAIKKDFFSTEVIGLFLCEEDHYVLDMLQAGARGFLLKDASGEEVVQAIRTVHSKKAYYSEEATVKMHQIISDKPRSQTAGKRAVLSEKEKLIIRLICQEYSTKQIADHLQISCRSVESTRERMMEKIGAKNMVGVAVYALKHGFYECRNNAAS